MTGHLDQNSLVAMADTNCLVNAHLPDIQLGTLTLYQLYDIGDEIDLDKAQICLTKPTVHRHIPPVRVRQSESIQIAQPPVRVNLDIVKFALDGVSLAGTLRASIYDLGAVALAMELSLPQPIGWSTVADLLRTAQDLPEFMQDRFLAALE
ncbi:MAG: hypothetical protein JO235_11500, partial [Chroococcidiopsidaceae cyanobacterium CP_BM_RX_35]|nr:hypothetical protein [Chroococcidiopsidaceae cyanobacterium CP_BM_RX_35]